MKQTSSINFGGSSLPVSFTFQTPEGDNHYLWTHLCQCGADSFDLWIGINHDEPDLILRDLDEIDAFVGWLRALPSDPHLNSRYGIKIENTVPDLAGEYPDAEHLTIPCTVGIIEGVKVYALTHGVDAPGEIACYTRWPCSASHALAQAMAPLIEAIRGQNIDIRPAFNPLDTED